MSTIIFGDSLAGNYGIAPLPAWPQILAENASLDISHTIHKNGYTTTDLLECLNREIISLGPDRIILICGSNDAVQMRDFTVILQTIGWMGGELLAVGADMIWLMPPRIDAKAASQRFGDPVSIYDHANQTLELVRQHGDLTGVRTMDLEELRQAFQMQNAAGGISAYTDGLHFTFEFHQYLAESLRRVLGA